MTKPLYANWLAMSSLLLQLVKNEDIVFTDWSSPLSTFKKHVNKYRCVQRKAPDLYPDNALNLTKSDKTEGEGIFNEAQQFGIKIQVNIQEN